MAGFSRAERQQIIDDYLAESGVNSFVPHRFVDWLADKPDHPVFDLFYGMSDEHAAREFRVGLARNLASGLRIIAQVRLASPNVTQIKLTTREFPAMISPIDGRKHGGGYIAFNTEDRVMIAELRRQGAQALRSWLGRYRGVAELIGVDLRGIEEIAGALEGAGVAQAESA